MPITLGSTNTACAPRLRVFVADDSPVVREGLARIISDECDMTVANSAASAAELRAIVRQETPAVLVMDLMLGDADGLALIEELLGQVPELRLVVFTAQPQAVYASRCLRAGARAFVGKRDSVGSLLRAIRETAAGGLVVPPGIPQRVVSAPDLARGGDEDVASQLTNRELQVFRLVGLGQPTKAIASALGISVKTVESHREHIKNKLVLASHHELVARAAQWLRDGAGI